MTIISIGLVSPLPDGVIRCPVCTGLGWHYGIAQTRRYGSALSLTTAAVTCERCDGLGVVDEDEKRDPEDANQ